MKHRTAKELMDGLDDVRRSPREEGTLEMIVVRPASDERALLEECRLSARSGAEGDVWAQGSWKKLPDGSPHPDVQISLINRRSIDLLTRDKSRWPLAGDNLYVDFDLGEDHIAHGQKIAVGEAILEVTAVPHTACGKFVERYGMDASNLVNSETGMALRLRGLFAKVLQDGLVRVGDKVRKL